MTDTQRQQFERALARARRDGLQVVAHGTLKATGAPVFCVPSNSQPGTWHVVVDGLDLRCDCPAGQHGRYCAYRAAVRASLILEAEVRRDTRERAAEQAVHSAERKLEQKIAK